MLEQVGNCPLEIGGKRVPIGSLTYEKFRIMQSLNNLRMKSPNETLELNNKEKKALFDQVYKCQRKYVHF